MIAIILIAVYYAVNSYMKSKNSNKDKSEKIKIKYDDKFDDDENNLVSSIYNETQGKPLDYKKLTNEEVEEDEPEENNMKDRISKMLKDDNKIPEYSGGSEEKEDLGKKEIENKEPEDKYNNFSGYRKFRKGFGSGGKH